MGIVKGEFRLRIERDLDGENPRTEYGKLGTMIHWHTRMDVGDERIDRPYDQEEYDVLIEEFGIVVPVFMYEHGGVMIRTQPFTCTWDSGQVGFIAITMDKVREAYDIKPGAPISDDIQTIVVSVLEAEVKIYDDYINGNCWGFELEQLNTCDCCDNAKWEHVDSCWGFAGGGYGDEDDGTKDAIGEHIEDEHKHLLDAAWENRT